MRNDPKCARSRDKSRDISRDISRDTVGDAIVLPLSRAMHQRRLPPGVWRLAPNRPLSATLHGLTQQVLQRARLSSRETLDVARDNVEAAQHEILLNERTAPTIGAGSPTPVIPSRNVASGSATNENGFPDASVTSTARSAPVRRSGPVAL
jgi:hypothetical protein